MCYSVPHRDCRGSSGGGTRGDGLLGIFLLEGTAPSKADVRVCRPSSLASAQRHASTALRSASRGGSSSQYSRQLPNPQGASQFQAEWRMEVRGAAHCSEAAACDCRMLVAAELAGGHSGHSEVMTAEGKPGEEDPPWSRNNSCLSQPPP